MILNMFFLTFSNANMLFAERKLNWWSYILAKTLLTTKRVQIITYKKFATIVLNSIEEVFIIYIAYLGTKISIYLAWKV